MCVCISVHESSLIIRNRQLIKKLCQISVDSYYLEILN